MARERYATLSGSWFILEGDPGVACFALTPGYYL
jgi:hypothetical protein